MCNKALPCHHFLTIHKVRNLTGLLDCTTAWVCAEVPDAILVSAQAASNCNEGL